MMKNYILSKLVLFFVLTFGAFGLTAQTVTLTFTARDGANRYLKLNRVVITNLTKSWQETIYYPDTVLTMQNGTGIDDHTPNGGFVLSQNNPNPFSNTTDVTLTVMDEGKVNLDITDVHGRIIETFHEPSLQSGIHQFRISLSAAGTYVMTARQNGKTSSIKMICNGGGGTNTIDYLGEAQTLTYVLKSSTNKPFNFGDQMEYVGYASINGTMVESQHISQAQGNSQTFTLQFAAIGYQLPIVTTHAVTDVTNNSATCGGTINSDGGATVTARGICWSATPNPTISGLHTTNGGGTGSFSSSITGLTPNITYYVRAYATNAAGTAYGQQETFRTNASLPTVTTSTPTNITTTTAVLGGNVSSDGGSTVTERGVCWSNSQYPTLNTPHLVIGTGTGNFSGNLTYFTPGTTYYVRAYATNSVGTAYGQMLSFTTLANLPEVTTGDAINVTASTATCSGYVTSDGGGSVTARGVCWSISQNPTLNDNHTTDGSGTGYFTSNLTGLTAGITYYVRAYATNSAGTAYGEQRTFTTLSTPMVTTNTVSNIAGTSATCGGNVTSQGGSSVTARGVCWSATQNPTVSNSHTTDGGGTGNFTSIITGLTANTAYYVRAYATNSVGTAYGELRSFTTSATTPTVLTAPVSEIAAVSAYCGGYVTSDGGGYVTACGVCWSTSQNPTVSGSHTTAYPSSSTGQFTMYITGLAANTTYYVRAYATNSAGTGYGEQVSFTTPAQDGQPCLNVTTVSDYDGNTYNTVQIGSQCWMKENLRTTHYSNGVSIPLGGNSISETSPYYYNYSSSSIPLTERGYLYNWPAVMHGASSSLGSPSGVQGICPTGWHVPSRGEWTQLIYYVSSQSGYRCSTASNSIAKALSSTSRWQMSTNTCAVGNIQGTNNATGFGAVPGGCYGYLDTYLYSQQSAVFSSATYEYSFGHYGVAHVELLFNQANTGCSSGSENKSYGYSVRCLKD